MYIQKIILFVFISKFLDKMFYNFEKFKKCDEMFVSIREIFIGMWVYIKNIWVNVGMDNIKFMINFQL